MPFKLLKKSRQYNVMSKDLYVISVVCLGESPQLPQLTELVFVPNLDLHFLKQSCQALAARKVFKKTCQ